MPPTGLKTTTMRGQIDRGDWHSQTLLTRSQWPFLLRWSIRVHVSICTMLHTINDVMVKILRNTSVVFYFLKFKFLQHNQLQNTVCKKTMIKTTKIYFVSLYKWCKFLKLICINKTRVCEYKRNPGTELLTLLRRKRNSGTDCPTSDLKVVDLNPGCADIGLHVFHNPHNGPLSTSRFVYPGRSHWEWLS